MTFKMQGQCGGFDEGRIRRDIHDESRREMSHAREGRAFETKRDLIQGLYSTTDLFYKLSEVILSLSLIFVICKTRLGIT